MLVFLDDSGDPGFKIGKGSSEVFVIALVIFDDDSEAKRTAKQINGLKKSMDLSKHFEFHFNKCSKKFRCRFLSTVADCKFRVRAIVMRKDRIYGKELRKSKESFYNYSVKTVLKHHGGTIKEAKLRLDGRGDRSFKRALSLYLRRELGPIRKTNSKVISSLSFVDSKKDVLIQLADMVAGAIYRSYNRNKKDCDIYRGIISERIKNIWDFGYKIE